MTCQLCMFIMLAGSTVFIGLLLLVQCMKSYDDTHTSSMFVGSFVTSTTIMSATHCNTFDHLCCYSNFILHPASVIMLLFGIFTLGCNNNDDTSNNEHDDEHDSLFLKVICSISPLITQIVFLASPSLVFVTIFRLKKI